MIVEEIVWNEMFSESSGESFKRCDKVEVGLNSMIEKGNANKSRRTWNKGVNKLVMKCHLMCQQFWRGYRKMYDIYQDIGNAEESRTFWSDI